MNSTLKILVPLVLLIVVVFAVTFFSQYTPDPVDPAVTKGPETGQKPLKFFSATRRWDPVSDSLQDRAFAGFYETGETQHGAAFWFSNDTGKPVDVQLKGVSCSACSGGRLAPIPPDATKLLLQMTAVSLLPTGAVAACPPGLAGAAANLTSGLQWQSHAFNKDPKEVTYTVPGAPPADGWSPQWGILELNFKVRPNPNVPLRAAFVSQVQGTTDQIGTDEFSIYFEPAAAFDLDRTAIDVGELTDSSSPQTQDILIYSSTRTAAEMPDLTVRVQMPAGAVGEPGPFVTAGSPTPLSPTEVEQFAVAHSIKVGRPVRVRCAYRVPVTIKPREGEQRADIGKLERDIWVSVSTPGTEPKRVTVKGSVRGLIHLSEGTEINLESFKFTAGTVSKPVGITTERTGVELAVVEDQCRPKFMKVDLKKLPDRGDQGYYEVRLTIPKDEQQGEITDGVLVLEVKGPNPQRVRIPVKGRGTR